jgi:hypothetical protein
MINNPNNSQQVSYSKDKIEELLNIVNTFHFVGFAEATKLMKVYEILQEPFRVKPIRTEKIENAVKVVKEESK